MKKVLSIFLALLMALSTFSAYALTASAATTVSTYQELWNAVNRNDSSIVLSADIKYTIPDGGNQPLSPYQFLLNLDGQDNIFIDLNGYSLTVNNSNTAWPKQSALFNSSDNSSLTVQNGSITLYNYNNSARTDCGVFRANDNSYISIENVDVTTMRYGSPVKAYKNSTVNIEGGTISALSSFAVSALGDAYLTLGKNVKLRTVTGDGMITQFGNSGYGSLHCESPNLTIASATFNSGIEVSEANIANFTPDLKRYVFVEGTEYNTAFPTTKTGKYYWYEATGGWVLANAQGNLSFARDIQIIDKQSKQKVFVDGGIANPNYAAFGETVTVTAVVPAEREFSYWVVNGGGVYLEDNYAKQTTFVMGADTVNVKSVFDNGMIPIHGITVNLTFPEYNRKPSQATVTADGVSVEDTWWVELVGNSFGDFLDSNDVFKADTTYRCGVNLEIENGYFPANDFSVTFKDAKTGKTVATEEGATNTVRIHDFTVPPLPEITSLPATISGLNAGKTVSSLSAKAGADSFTTSIYGVYDTDNPFDANSTNRLASDAKLQNEHTYVFAVEYKPKEGYAIAKSATSVINGQDGLIGSHGSGTRIFYTALTVTKVTGWNKEDGIWRYYDGNGNAVTGWKQISGVWYYFDDGGVMQTGWQKVGNYWYYFKSGGQMVTGWQKIGSVWYYFKSGGQMVTGWQKIGGVWYYFKSGGAMVTGWQKIGGVWYYFKSGGAMVTGWQKISNKWYYFESSGAMRTANLYYKGKTYRFNSSGACINP